MSDQTDSANRVDLRASKSAGRHAAARCNGPKKRDLRFRQLLDKARSGDEIALHSLWAEYGVDYAKEGGRYE